MKRSNVYLALVFCFLVFPVIHGDCYASGQNVDVLVSTFPINQITRNVVRGRDNVRVSLMIPAQMGCPHDYDLTPQDMQKLSRADILIINGLGMEEFLGAPMDNANHGLTVIDSSVGIRDILHYSEDADHESGDHDAAHEEGHHKEHQDHAGGDHHHAGVNPHVFASPRMTAVLAMNIAQGLAKADPKGAEIYFANARNYAGRMNRLADAFKDLGKRLSNNRIVTQHGVFDYLARDMGLEIVAVVEAHAGQEPSASAMLDIIRTIKLRKAGAVFTEPQYPDSIGRTIARESGILAAVLDPVATGPENAPLDYYETIMETNLTTLEKTLGTK
ncbi:MAG: metal ABC transporter substrate-binding protein [Pseudomonadota bacterium]